MRKFSTMTGAVLVLLAALAMIVFVPGCGSVPPDAAATVNGVVISKEDVAKRLAVAAGLNPKAMTIRWRSGTLPRSL
jgi:hypothetical protein